MTRPKTLALQLNTLEARDVPAASLTSGTLNLIGTSGNDSFQVVENGGQLVVVGQKIAVNGKLVASVNMTFVKAIYTNLGSGNDFVDITDIPINLTAIGGTGNDYVAGGSKVNSVYGREGDDTIIGGDAADKLYGEIGDDSIFGGLGKDLLSGGAGDDELDGGDADDKINGDAGDDSILGGAGVDKIDGGADNDSIDGGDDNDSILGSAGDDLIEGGEGNDRLYGGAGSDEINGGFGDDLIFGDDGTDFLNGDEGNDTIAGGSGADFINGGEGDDYLFPGSLSDIVNGGGGDDVIDENEGGGDGGGDGGGGGNQGTGVVTPTIRSEWQSGLTVDMAVNNAGNAVMKGWKVEFDADFVITTLWNANMTRVGKHYTITSKPNFWNTNIPKGGTILFGFNANKAVDGTTDFSNLKLNGVAV